MHSSLLFFHGLPPSRDQPQQQQQPPQPSTGLEQAHKMMLAATHEDDRRLSMQQWEQAMTEATLDKAAVNSLVMNYLIVEGFQSVAEQFQQEANTKGSVPLSSITGRTSVRSALSAGRIDDGLREINTILPTLLEHNPSLLLQLQQQQLVELIRADKIDEALTFARTHLRAGCADQAHALQALEGIMSLLAFSALPPEHNPMAHLLDQRARVTLAGAVNDAILEGQFACKESQLQRVAKHTIHSQQQLANFLPEFPKLPVDPTAAASSAGATATPASSSGSSSSSRALLDPASLYESLATSEAAARKAAEDKAAAELALVITALEQERAAREERERARRARQAAFAAARAAEPRSAFRHDNPPVEEDDDDEEEEQRRAALAAEQQEEEDEEEEEEDEGQTRTDQTSNNEEEEEEDANMATFV